MNLCGGAKHSCELVASFSQVAEREGMLIATRVRCQVREIWEVLSDVFTLADREGEEERER